MAKSNEETPSWSMEDYSEQEEKEAVIEANALGSAVRTDPAFPANGFNLERYMDRLHQAFIEEALKRTGGVVRDAALLLRMNSGQLKRFAQKYGIEPDRSFVK